MAYQGFAPSMVPLTGKAPTTVLWNMLSRFPLQGF